MGTAGGAKNWKSAQHRSTAQQRRLGYGQRIGQAGKHHGIALLQQQGGSGFEHLTVVAPHLRDARALTADRTQHLTHGGSFGREGDRLQARLIGVFQRGIVAAVEPVAQQSIALRARMPHPFEHARQRHAHQSQSVRGQHQRAFENFGHHLGSASLAQLFQRAIVHGAHHHRHMRRMFMHEMQDAQRRMRLDIGDDQRTRPLQAGRLQRSQPGGVAIHHVLPGGLGLRHAVGIEVERKVRNVLGVEQARQILPAAAEAADDDVVLRLDGTARDIGELQRGEHPVRRGHLEHNAVDVLRQQRGVEHGNDHGRQHRIEHLGRNERVARRDIDQHDAEFTRRRQPQRHPQAQPRRRFSQTLDAEHQRRLDQRRQHGQQQHQPPLRQHKPPVEQHADGDEKQAEQHVAEGANIRFHLRLVGRLGDQHPGEKSPQRHRQPRHLGDPRQTEREQQQVEHEQLVRLALDHNAQPRLQQPPARQQNDGQHQHRFDQCQRQQPGQIAAVRGHGWNENQQGHHRQILKQQHADDVATMRRIELDLLRQQFDHDGRGRHGKRAAKGNACRNRLRPELRHEPGERQTGQQHHRQGREHLRRAQPEHQRTHGFELPQAELQPDGKHQEHHAELGQMLHARSISGQGQRVGPDDHAHRQIAEHGRHGQRTKQGHAQHGGNQIKQSEFEAGHRGEAIGARGLYQVDAA